MLIFNRENLFDFLEEAGPLIFQHWQEVATNQDKIPLDPDWKMYKALQDLGAFVAYTARDEEKLVGYAWFFLNPHIHYKSTKVATNDIIYFRPQSRGFGPIRFIRYCENELKQLGATKITYHIKTSLNFSRVLERQGYKVTEVNCEKYIGD